MEKIQTELFQVKWHSGGGDKSDSTLPSLDCKWMFGTFPICMASLTWRQWWSPRGSFFCCLITAMALYFAKKFPIIDSDYSWMRGKCPANNQCSYLRQSVHWTSLKPFVVRCFRCGHPTTGLQYVSVGIHSSERSCLKLAYYSSILVWEVNGSRRTSSRSGAVNWAIDIVLNLQIMRAHASGMVI
jgi:hypothetical protein